MEQDLIPVQRASTWACISFVVLLSAHVGCSRSPSNAEASAASKSTHSPQSQSVARTRDITDQPATGVNKSAPHQNDFSTSADAIVIGLDADLTSASARSGAAIQRGVRIALNEINQAGGILGRPMELISRDHRGNPTRGIDNIRELTDIPNVVAIMGGIHTPVALEELATIHEMEVPFLIPWAAGTPLVTNGYEPNYVFRVSVRDEYAGEFLVKKAIEADCRRLAVLLEQTGWGRSNEVAIRTALAKRDLVPETIQWFHWGDPTIQDKVNAIAASDADAVLLVANPLEGADVVQSMAKVAVADRIPVISHWGITASDFPSLVGNELQDVNLVFLQSYSFLIDDPTTQSVNLVDAYCAAYDDANGPRDIFSPVGTAHAYELTKMLAQAIRDAESVDRKEVRNALEQLGRYEGMIRTYDRPFPPGHHDALGIEDLRLARYDDEGVIVPVANTVVFHHD